MEFTLVIEIYSSALPYHYLEGKCGGVDGLFATVFQLHELQE